MSAYGMGVGLFRLKKTDELIMAYRSVDFCRSRAEEAKDAE
jgi:hypothetical protein